MPEERWGWEYVEPDPPRPFLQDPPEWEEPPAPNVRVVLPRLTPARVVGIYFLASIITGIAAVAFRIPTGPAWAAWVVLMAALLAGPRLTKRIVERRRLAAFRARRDSLYARYREMHDEWTTAKQRHDLAELERWRRAARWRPVAPRAANTRIDVVGGTPAGWSGLVATLGSSILAQGRMVVLIDLTDQRVGAGLDALAEMQSYEVTRIDAVRERGSIAWFSGLGVDALGDFIAEIADDLRGGASTEQRHADAELVSSIASDTAAPVTVSSLAAALGRRQDPAAGFLHGCLRLLASPPDESGAGGVRGLLSALRPGLCVVTCDDEIERRREVTAVAAVHLLARELRQTHAGAGRGGVLIVAGTDRLGRTGLRRLADGAARAQMRLVTISPGFGTRGDEWLGGGDALVVMRLGTSGDAEKAAWLIGKGHRFTYSGVTLQAGDSVARGVSQSAGGQRGTAATVSLAGHALPSVGLSRSRIRSWQETVSATETTTASVATALSRTYDFLVEPTAIQQLPQTAFILVDSTERERRPVLADCNPGIAMLAAAPPSL